MSDTDPDTTPQVHPAEIDAVYWVLWERWRRHPNMPPDSAAIRDALLAAKRAMAER